MSQTEDWPEIAELLRSAKAGSRTALGLLLERYRHYAALLIRLQVGRSLQAKVDVEDLIQEVHLEVHRKMRHFRGDSEPEFLAWLRRILGAILANQMRHYFGTRGRDPRLERMLEEALDRSSEVLDRG